MIGITLPLITKSDGTKFGKTETGAVWLESSKTSPYRFYQFWLNSDDADVYRFLAYYTFLSMVQIEDIRQADTQCAGKPQAQQILAEQVTRLVHGEQGLAAAQRITQALFSGDLSTLNLSELRQLEQDGLPCVAASRTDTLLDWLLSSGLASSKRQAREWLAQGAIRVNGERVAQEGVLSGFALFDQYYVLQRGKKQFVLIKLAGLAE